MKNNGLAAASIAVFDRYGIVYAEGFGSRDSSGRRKTDTGTVFQAASLGKVITAYAALILVDRGQLSLDAPAQSYLPVPFLTDSKYRKKITIRMLLNHTSGLKNDPDGLDRDVHFTPGSAFSYSGAGFRYLQAVIESVTVMPFNRFVEREILNPLGMTSSTFDPESYESFPLQEPLPAIYSGPNAAYSLVSTPSDMAGFMRELQSPSLVNGRLVVEMLAPSVRVNSRNSWGLGVGLQKTPAGNTVWHWGKNRKGYQSLMILDIASSVGCVVMIAGPEAGGLLKRIAAQAIGGYHFGYWEGLPSDLELFRNDRAAESGKKGQGS